MCASTTERIQRPPPGDGRGLSLPAAGRGKRSRAEPAPTNSPNDSPPTAIAAALWESRSPLSVRLFAPRTFGVARMRSQLGTQRTQRKSEAVDHTSVLASAPFASFAPLCVLCAPNHRVVTQESNPIQWVRSYSVSGFSRDLLAKFPVDCLRTSRAIRQAIRTACACGTGWSCRCRGFSPRHPGSGGWPERLRCAGARSRPG